MADIIKKSAFVIVLALLLLGCGAFDKQLYLYVPGRIDEADVTGIDPVPVSVTASVTVAYPVLSTLSIQLSVSDNGKERIALDTGGPVIDELGVTATFTVTTILDTNDTNTVTATITASAAGYTSDSVKITIVSNVP